MNDTPPAPSANLEVIADEDLLRRRVPPQQVDSTGKIMSIFFRTEDMSVDICRLRRRSESRAVMPSAGLVEFRAGLARKEGLQPTHDPEPDNYAHAICKGKLSSGKAQRLRDAADYCVKVGEPATDD